MKDLGINCVRVFLTYHSIHFEQGELNTNGIAKFDQFLDVAENAGIYVHPAGPEFWEGPPHWKPVALEDERTLNYTCEFWKKFAARYRNRHVIFAYDLKNEPSISWNNDIIGHQIVIQTRTDVNCALFNLAKRQPTIRAPFIV